MRGPFDILKCDLKVGEYFRLSGKLYKPCVDHYIRKIKNGSVEIYNMNDSTHPGWHYYIECDHYIVIDVLIKSAFWGGKQRHAAIIDVRRYP